MPEENESFRDMNKKEKTLTVIGILLLIIFIVALVFGFYFFGIAGAFKLLGVQYNSIWSLVIFAISFFILGIFVEFFIKALYKISVRNLTGKKRRFFIRILFETSSNFIVLFTVDEFMKSIHLPLQTDIIIAVLFAVLELVFDDKD